MKQVARLTLKSPTKTLNQNIHKCFKKDRHVVPLLYRKAVCSPYPVSIDNRHAIQRVIAVDERIQRLCKALTLMDAGLPIRDSLMW